MVLSHGLILPGGNPGAFKGFLDHLRIRHADDNTAPIRTTSKDTL